MAPGKKASSHKASGPRVAKSNPRTAFLEGKLTLLWLCFKNKKGPVDWKAVGEAYGITATAAQYRFYRVRDFMKSFAPPEKESDSDGATGDDNGDNEPVTAKINIACQKSLSTTTDPDVHDEHNDEHYNENSTDSDLKEISPGTPKKTTSL
ncbi:hypothetical protein N7468_001459 [Penicillium chermesinum]|uniref:Myb-like DNA-binding domain-containing protein n=1 Tax=Penicillium chermesinum TaxID=63820 RepID=A0A9W9PID6_9EURO|nr:uncharacterized protein N7468_001459 [Penicillium chermesinum]KAJ5246476.1 hypothetical protein N7468_001459 [Penicillium chermesinum]KAJ6144748.1 hypothetical protein N7470_008643 [Penicillium chermesinum]